MSIDETLVKISDIENLVQSLDSIDMDQRGLPDIVEAIHDVFVCFEIHMPIDSVDTQMCYSDICHRVEKLHVCLKKGQYESILSDIYTLLEKLKCSINYYLT